MKYRKSLVAGAGVTSLLAAGLAMGSDVTIVKDVMPTTTTSSPALSTVTVERPTKVPAGGLLIPDGSSLPIDIGHAGTIIVGRLGESLRIVSSTPKAGWTPEIYAATGSMVSGGFWNERLGVNYQFDLIDGVVWLHIETTLLKDLIGQLRPPVRANANVEDPVATTTTTTVPDLEEDAESGEPPEASEAPEPIETPATGDSDRSEDEAEDDDEANTAGDEDAKGEESDATDEGDGQRGHGKGKGRRNG